MPHRNERCRPSRPPPTGPPKLRAEESVPQDLTVIGVHCLNTYIGALNVTLDLPAEALARLQSEAIRRGITVDQLVTDLANSLPTDDPLEAFIGIRLIRSGPAPSRDTFRADGRSPRTRSISHGSRVDTRVLLAAAYADSGRSVIGRCATGRRREVSTGRNRRTSELRHQRQWRTA